MKTTKIKEIIYNSKDRTCKLIDEEDRLINFSDLIGFDWSGDTVWVDWENSGPSGPWIRSLTYNCIKLAI